MPSNGGSAAIREAIEARRAKIEAPGTSVKMLNKNAERMKAWWNEKISIAFLDEHGEPEAGCAWTVLRRHLRPSWLRKICLNCPMHTKIEYLRDQISGDIVWPADAQMQCRPPPWSYAVIAVEERSVIDQLKDPGYHGDVQVTIFNVPFKTNDNQTEVSPEDIKVWLLSGLQEEDEEFKEAQEIIHVLEEEASEVEHSLSRVGYIEFEEKSGFGKNKQKTLTEEEKAAKRQEFHKALSAQRQQMEEDLNEARAALTPIEEQWKKTAVDVELASAQPNCGTCTYYISFPGYQGSRLEDILCAKTDWPGIKLATKHDGLPPWAGRGKIPDGSKRYIPSYTDYAVNMRAVRICRLQHGFGQYKTTGRFQPCAEPQESHRFPIQYHDPRAHTNYATDTQVARTRKAKYDSSDSVPPSADPSTVSTPRKIAQLNSPIASASPPGSRNIVNSTGKASKVDDFKGTDGGQDGKSSEAPSGLSGGGKKKEEEEGDDAGVPFAGEAFSFYHGEYKEGLRRGFGIEITDAGVYIGEHSTDRRSGAGELLYANGDHIEGNFVSETRFPEADSSTNPYKEGVPSGLVKIRFASGATYKGEMKQGRITGKGDYISCLGERYSGDFVDGRLDGPGSMADVVGQMWSGQWRDGEMNGEGTYFTPKLGEFDGDWVRGEWQGKGRILFKGGNTYEGFFMDHCRSGPGTLLKGNVKSVYDPRSGGSVLRSNRVYVGNWRASELRPGSMVTLTRTGVTLCLGANEAGWYNRAIDRIKRREQQVQHRTAESVDFYMKYDAISRQQVEAKKSRLYSKQAKLANQDLINDHFKKLTADDVKAEHLSRAKHIKRVTGNHLKGGTGSIAQGAEKLHQIAAVRGTAPNTTLLCTLMQSRFEEAQELQQLVDMPDGVAAAEALAHAQQADMNY